MTEELLRKNARLVGHDCLEDFEEEWLPLAQLDLGGNGDFIQQVTLAFKTVPGFCGFIQSSADRRQSFYKLLQPGEYFIRLSNTFVRAWYVVYFSQPERRAGGRLVGGTVADLFQSLNSLKRKHQLHNPMTLTELIERRKE